MKKVLIIEDDKVVAGIYSNRLQTAGLETAMVLDGEAGLVALQKMKPDLVLLDLGLPKMNGLEVLKHIRSSPDLGKIPVVVFTNAYQSTMIQEAWKAGATSCLLKANSTPNQVIEAVHKALAATAPTVAPPVPSPIPAPPPAPAAPIPSSRDADASFVADLRQSFLKDAPAGVTAMRSLLQQIARSEGDSARLPRLQELYRKTHSMSSNAGIVGLAQIARVTAAMETLLKDIYEDPKRFTPSTLRTAAQAIDFVTGLLDHSHVGAAATVESANILVVDDESISRRAVVHSLEKAALKCVSLEDPAVALNMVAENRFDLILLDIDMPKINGFELCEKIRATTFNQKTPVVFVTGLTDFASRAKVAVSGGNDLIGKPFLFAELALKSLVHLLKGRLTPTRN